MQLCVRNWRAEGFSQVPGHSIFARPLRIRGVVMLWNDESRGISVAVGRSQMDGSVVLESLVI